MRYVILICCICCAIATYFAYEINNNEMREAITAVIADREPDGMWGVVPYYIVGGYRFDKTGKYLGKIVIDCTRETTKDFRCE